MLKERALQALYDIAVNKAKVGNGNVDRIEIIQRVEKMAGKRLYEIISENRVFF